MTQPVTPDPPSPRSTECSTSVMPSSLPTMDPLLELFLAQRDTPCPGCRYSLLGLKTPRCPECNQELTLNVLLVEPKLAAWITGLVGLCAGAGFGLFILAYFLYEFLAASNRGPGPRLREVMPLMVCSTVLVVILLAWLAQRRAICRSPGRWFFAAVCWLICIATPIIFFTSVR